MSLGIFDTIGPIMHGPSSNHTGGMVKIGAMARSIMGGCPKDFVIEMSPTLLNIHLGQRTHVAAMAGMLGMRESDLECNSSLEMAKALGISFRSVADSGITNRNVIRICGEVNGHSWSVEGDSIGAGSIIITSVCGVTCSLDGNAHCCIIRGEQSLVEKAVGTAREYVLPEIYSGKAEDGSFVAILQSSKEFGSGNVCPKAVDKDIPSPCEKSRDLTIHIAPALTKFYPKGDYPLKGKLSFEKLLELTENDSLSNVLIDYECARDGVTREEVIEQCEKTFDVMMDTLERGKNGAIHLIGGITDPEDGGKLLKREKEGTSIVSGEFSELLGNALISSGMNASGERIVATPTGGSSGVLPACLGVYTKKFNAAKEDCLDACFAAAAVGMVYGEHLNFTGTGAGCQSEIGVSAGMAAAAVVSLAGGSVEAMFHASAIAAKNLLGLTCDIPIGPVEVPCIKRNAIASAIAVAAAEMALAGVRSAISPDGVASAMADTAKCMPSCLRCNQEHGLAGTETATGIKAYWAERLSKLE